MSLQFIKLDLADWADGTCEMTLAQEGAYLRICAALYRAGGTLPDDDARIAKRLRLDIRSWRHHRKYLLEEGKIVAEDGTLSQPRVTNELANIDAKSTRHRSKNAPTSKEHQPNINATLSRSRSDLPKKPNKNNGKFRQNKKKNKNIDIPPPSPPSVGRAEIRSAGDMFPDPYAVDNGVYFANGRITLVDHAEQFWLEQFGGCPDELMLALTAIGPDIRPNDRRPAAAQIQKRLADMARGRRERDKRYAVRPRQAGPANQSQVEAALAAM